MKEFAKRFYSSNAWKECRKAYAKSKGNLCERCLAKGIITPAVIVHHKVYLTPDNIDNPNITLDWSNLECVCRACHEEEHDNKRFITRKRKRRYTVDEFGRVTTSPPI